MDPIIQKTRFVDLYRANLDPENTSIDMGKWINSCGTAGCAAGNYALKFGEKHGLKVEHGLVYQNDNEDGKNLNFDGWAHHFGVGIEESIYMFDAVKYLEGGVVSYVVSRELVLSRIAEIALLYGIDVIAETASKE